MENAPNKFLSGTNEPSTRHLHRVARLAYTAPPGSVARRAVPGVGDVPCETRTTSFQPMRKRRRGFQQRDPGQARAALRPRRQRAAREARPQRPPARAAPAELFKRCCLDQPLLSATATTIGAGEAGSAPGACPPGPRGSGADLAAALAGHHDHRRHRRHRRVHGRPAGGEFGQGLPVLARMLDRDEKGAAVLGETGPGRLRPRRAGEEQTGQRPALALGVAGIDTVGEVEVVGPVGTDPGASLGIGRRGCPA